MAIRLSEDDRLEVAHPNDPEVAVTVKLPNFHESNIEAIKWYELGYMKQEVAKDAVSGEILRDQETGDPVMKNIVKLPAAYAESRMLARIVGWRGIVGKDGQELPFADENKVLLANPALNVMAERPLFDVNGQEKKGPDGKVITKKRPMSFLDYAVEEADRHQKDSAEGKA